MRKNTGLIVLVIILSIFVILLGGYIVYDKVLDVDSDVIDNGNNDYNVFETYDFNSLEGYYFETVNNAGLGGGLSFSLYLLKDGIFKLGLPDFVPHGYIGNYTINGDVLTLNYWFSYGSGVGWNLVSDTKNIRINSLNSLEVDLKSFNLNDFDSDLIVLQKDDSIDVSNFDFYNDLKVNVTTFYCE